MHTEAGNRGTTRTRGDGDVFQIDRVADLGDRAAGTWPGGYAPGNRSAPEFGEQRLVVPEGIGFVTIGFAAPGRGVRGAWRYDSECARLRGPLRHRWEGLLGGSECSPFRPQRRCHRAPANGNGL